MYQGAPTLQRQVESAVQEDPMRAHLATPEENFQYQDLVRRGLMLMSDTKDPGKGIGSPSENMLNAIRNENIPLQESMGVAFGNVVKLLYTNAAAQGYEYDPAVVVGAMDELSKAFYMLAKSQGAISSGPPGVAEGGTPAEDLDLQALSAEDPLLQQQIQNSDYEPSIAGESATDEIDYEFSEEELEFLEEVKLRATEFVGKYLDKNGMIDRDAWKTYAKDQVIRERDQGRLEDQEMPYFNPQAVEDMQLQREMGNGME